MAQATSRGTVLLVDDNRELLGLLRAWLKRTGLAVLEAHDGQEGLVAYEAAHPDLVVADLAMPVVDGDTMCRAIRASNDRVPIIVYSGCEDDDRLTEVGRLPGTVVVQKGTSVRPLIDLAERLVSSV